MFAKQKVINRVVLLNIHEIASSPYQPRKQFEPGAMQELADSIGKNGLLQPITVRRTEETNRYELIAGERRLMACRMLRMEKIPAIIEEYDDEKAAIFALVENLQRKDLNYFEEAQGIYLLMQQCCLTQQQVAEKLCKAQSTIANKLRLLSFDEHMRRRILEAGLTERHARALLRLADGQMVEQALAYIIQERLNVGESERHIDGLLQKKEPLPPKATRLFVVKDLRIFMNTLSKAVATMKLAGIEVDTTKAEDDQYIHYKVTIPKKSAYRSYTA